ncbi:helix-turn-helix domain-containing protein [Schinkia azotoformans]|uniref:PucR family transcriptional regulator n=1 Tax=Schinkia azotoformans TaxID=1454 RepID=UPI002DB60BBF|nr:helix-turn-helix domain-containing protein [Schinkia azotoformans]MEC1722284.1 helix-turn-helix domain-containing protein [Schinkia azotoformans]MED4352019.1 helix-turn-helix domain-containing protein [Schinkia azotoformans]MED4414620.1 helix-turn-helix domain-containing protein [Schinkia azotoformans]
MQGYLEKALSLTEIHKIIEYVSHTLKRPVILEDDQFFLLSYSSYYINDFDQANQQTILSKKCPVPILEKFIETGIIEQLKSIIIPFRVKKIEEIGLNHRVVTSTKYKNEIMGYMWVQEIDGPLTEEEIEFLHEVSSHIGKILYKRNQVRREKDEKKVLFFHQLLKEQSKNEKQIRQEAELLNIRIPQLLKTIIFMLKDHDEEQFESLKDTVQSYLKVTDCMTEIVIESNKIIVILGERSQKDRIDEQGIELVNRVIKSLEQQNSLIIFAGIGAAYGQLTLLRKSFLESSEVIKAAVFLGTREHLSFEYENLGVYRYIQALAEHNKEVHYVNPKLEKLKQKDNENQTELLKTLEVYLKNNCKSKPTAEQLFIHPNTLNYRLKQIGEYTNIDFSDFNLNCQLFIDLLLMKSEGNK